MFRWRLSWEARRAMRRLAGGSILVAGLSLTLRFIPFWVWAVAAGLVATWFGVLILRDR